MRRYSECGAIRANVAVVVLATAVVLGVGVFIGATLLGESSARPPMSIEPARPTSPREAISPILLASAHSTDMDNRLAAIERGLEELRASHATAMERVLPSIAEFEQLKRAVEMPAPTGELGAGTPTEHVAGGMIDVRVAAKQLGLDAARSEAMQAQLALAVADIQALETVHAEVTREGAVTTIKIGTYGDRSTATVQRWQDWIDRNLSPEEKGRYEGYRLESRLLGWRSGAYDRTIRIEEVGGHIVYDETMAAKGSTVHRNKWTGPVEAFGTMRDRYVHLLPEWEAR